jgi:hypothetical protein
MLRTFTPLNLLLCLAIIIGITNEASAKSMAYQTQNSAYSYNNINVIEDQKTEPELQKDDLPEALKDWVDWTLSDYDPDKINNPCPFFYNSYGARECVWPASLKINVTKNGGEFKHTITVYKKSWVPIIGSEKLWPQDVKIGDNKAIVIKRNAKPMIMLDKGKYEITGKFMWKDMPESIAMPKETGIISLNIEDKKIDFPDVDATGNIWIRRQSQIKPVAAKKSETMDHMEIRAFRHIEDTIPTMVTTYLQLNVSGKHREITLDGALLNDFTPMELSSPLQSRLEENGKLRVQIKPGQWTISVKARANKPFKSLEFNKTDKQWPDDEIWTFEAKNYLRDVEIENVVSIDPTQIDMPQHLKRFPAYIIHNKDKMVLAEKKRGVENAVPDKLNLQRKWILHFDGKGYTVEDNMSGMINKSWRLDMKPGTKLGQVSINNQPQLITKLDDKGKEGVEVRLGSINMKANSRVEGNISDLDAIGWDHDFNSVQGTITLPPGWSVFHATGVDRITPTWVGKWQLLDIFMVMVASIAILKVFGKGYGLVALGALIFVHNELPEISVYALIIAGAITLLDVLPTGKFKSFTKFVKLFTILLLVIAVVPFLKDEIRRSLHPQLYNFSYDSYYSRSLNYNDGGIMQTLNQAPMMAEEAMDEITSVAADMEYEGTFGSGQVMSKASSIPGYRNDYKRKEEPRKIMISKGNIYAQQNELSMQNKLQNANVQTGFGSSQWYGETIYLSWNGQVDANQKVHLYLLSSNHNMIISFIRVIMLSLLSAILIVTPSKLATYSEFLNLNRRKVITAAIAMFVAVSVFMPSSAYADEKNIAPTEISSNLKSNKLMLDANLNNHEIPPEQYLQEMKRKLTEKQETPPRCLPDCVNISRTNATVKGNQLIVRQEIHVEGGEKQNTIVVPMPGIASNVWRPDSVIVNGVNVDAAMFDGTHLRLPLKKGVNNVVITGEISKADANVQLKFPISSGQTSASADGWEVSGVHDNGTADATIQFTKIVKEQPKAKSKELKETEDTIALTPTTLPPFMIVEREIELGLTWKIRNVVHRITPSSTGAVIEVPLLEGEVVTTPGIKVKDKKAILNLGGNTSYIAWDSVLKEKNHINLVAPQNASWVEIWKLNIGTVWHADISGIPRVSMPQSIQHVFTWHPWPGEKVNLAITRPQGVDGPIKTIDRVDVNIVPGLRSIDTTVKFVLRSSLGTPHTITLPKGSKNHSIKINGKDHPLRIKDNKITFPLTPGKQTIEVSWTDAKGIGTKLITPNIDLGAPSVNIKTNVKMPHERWLLLVGGSKVKPALLMWSMLPLILIISFGLGCIKSIPMKWYHWALLCLGLAQTNLVPVVLTVSWFLAIAYRGKHPAVKNNFLFNLRQLSIVFLTIVVVGCIIGGIAGGLLGSPEMYVTGFGSYRNNLNWYHDLSGNVLPSIWVVSVPILVYRIAMLLWALWLSFSIIKWVKWGWANYSKEGFWKEKTFSGIENTFKRSSVPEAPEGKQKGKTETSPSKNKKAPTQKLLGSDE